MSVFDNLSEHLASGTKRAIDVGSLVSAGASGAIAAITLNQVAVCLTIVSLLLNIAWMAFKLLYLRKHGGAAFWGARDD